MRRRVVKISGEWFPKMEVNSFRIEEFSLFLIYVDCTARHTFGHPIECPPNFDAKQTSTVRKAFLYPVC